MTPSEFDKFYGDRLLGMLVRCFAELKAIALARGSGAEQRLMDDARIGQAFTSLMRDGCALRDEIRKRLCSDNKPEDRGEQAQPPAKAGPQNGQSKPTTGAQGKPS